MLLCDLRISPRSAVTKIANCNNNSKQRKTNILQYNKANMPKYSYGENLLMLFNPSISLYLTVVQSATNTKVKSLQTREQIDKNTKMQDTESCKKTNHVMLLCDHKPRTTITRIANCKQCVWFACIFRVYKKTRIPAAVISMCFYVT